MDELAYSEPGPTKNPRNKDFVSGGSSSDSAAIVAAGYCPVALGTQTNGSIITPAAFCGVFGFASSYARLVRDGIVLLAPSIDTIGLLTVDLVWAERAALVLYIDWQKAEVRSLPVLGVPDSIFMKYLAAEIREIYENIINHLVDLGFEVRRHPIMDDQEIEKIYHSAMELVVAEMALEHGGLLLGYEPLLREQTKAGIRRGGAIVGSKTLTIHQKGQLRFRAAVHELMRNERVDLWMLPSTIMPVPAVGTITNWIELTFRGHMVTCQ